MRWLIVLATFLLSVLLYVDRVAISVAESSVMADLSLTKTQMGWVFSAFSLGYALFQTPGGRLADRLGARKVLSGIVTVWSIFTGLTALAGSWSAMLIVRFLFGAGEAGAFPGMASVVYSWIPMKERGLVQGINFSGSRLGAAFALPVIAALLTLVGWRTAFVMLMCVGFAWAIAWYLFFRDDPTEVGWLDELEREKIIKLRQPRDDRRDGRRGGVPIAMMITNRSIWALCAQYFASNFTFFFCLTWYFPQLKTQYALTGLQASLYAAMPLACGALGNWLSGWWVDRLYQANRWRLSRRLPASIGFVLAATGILGSMHAATPLSSSLWFSMAILGADMTLSPSWSTCIDIGRSNAGVVSGTMNMAGNIGSFVTALAFPYLLVWTGSSQPFFYIAAGLNVLAVIGWCLVDPTRPLDGHFAEPVGEQVVMPANIGQRTEDQS
ncbi:MAG: MFS transporter [Planctomycetales bacterium]|nr:MFS transporter [Planctomycetales bacterium]